MLDGGKVGKCEVGISGNGRDRGQRQEDSVGGPRPQILGGGRKRWGKVDRAALCSCRAVEEGEGRQPAAPTMCRRRLSVKNGMRGKWSSGRRNMAAGAESRETAAFGLSSSSSSVMWMS